MDIIETLEDFGLSEKEAKVYLTGLELGSASAGDIAIKSNLPRTLVYDLLEKLIILGLVSYSIVDHKKIFTMSNPEEMKNILERKTKKIDLIIPELNKIIKKEVTKRPKVEVFEGKKSVRTLLDTLLEKNNKEFLVYGGSRALYELDPYFIERWHKERIDLKICIRRIFDETREIKSRIQTQSDSLKLTEFRFLKGGANAPTPTIVCKNKVLLFHLEKTKYYAILIEDDEMAENHRRFFETLWEIAKK